MSDCAKCKYTKSDGLIGCEGPCNKWFHYSCTNITRNEFELLQKNRNLLYVCNSCMRSSEVTEKITLTEHNRNLNMINDKICKISEIVENKLQSKMSEFKNMFDIFRNDMSAFIKNEILNALRDNVNEVIAPEIDKLSAANVPLKPRYSDMLKKSSILLLPKNSEQRNYTTKADLFHNINPLEENINVSKVKNVSNGGLIISCNSVEESLKFKKLATEKMTDKYEIKEAGKLHPRIKVVGITEKHDEASILHLLTNQNKHVFDNKSSVKLISLKTLRSTNNVYQAVLQVDGNSYHAAMNSGQLAIGYDFCTVYDALEVRRCYKCCGFNHLSNNCNKKLACLKCSEEHDHKTCRNQNKCVNCLNASKNKPGLDVNHSAWDRCCPIYKEKVELLKSELFGNK